MRNYRKLIVVGGAVAALAVPSVASATQPASPGCFGQARSAGVHTLAQGPLPGGSDWGQMAADGGGNPANGNALNNALYKATYCS